MNILSRELMNEFREIFGKIQSDPNVRAMVLSSSKPDCFIAGADITYVFTVLLFLCAIANNDNAKFFN